MTALVLSLVALAVGPLVHHATRQRPAALDALEGFVLGAIGGLVLLHIMPDCVRDVGWLCLAPAALGFLGPELFERLLHRAAHSVHAVTLAIALLGLLLHAALDGVAVAGGAGGHLGSDATRLAAAVVLHRVPVGLTIWLLLRPHGALLPLSTLVLVAVATVVGFGTGGRLLGGISGHALAWFQALVAGTLLHVVLHRPHAHEHDEHDERPRRRPGGPVIIGALLGIGLVLSLSLLH
jgi:hypothetical protein